jgi:hypothetical protein
VLYARGTPRAANQPDRLGRGALWRLQRFESGVDLGASHLERRSKVHPLPLFALSEDAVSIPRGLKYHEGYGQRLGESTFDVRRSE